MGVERGHSFRRTAGRPAFAARIPVSSARKRPLAVLAPAIEAAIFGGGGAEGHETSAADEAPPNLYAARVCAWRTIRMKLS